MHFGAAVREILSASYGLDLRTASATTALPRVPGGPRRALAANLELAYGITLAPDELAHFGTVRDVLQCVRLHLWKRRHGATPEAAPPAAATVARAVFRPVTTDPGARFLRYTRRPEAASAPRSGRAAKPV